MIVSIVGMPQSGSTMVYNLVRLLLLKNQKKVYASWYTFDQNDKSFDHKVYKCHRYDDNLRKKSDLIINVVRDIRDSVCSFMKRKKIKQMKNDHLLAKINENLSWFFDWKEHTDYFFVYEKFKNNELKIAEELCKKLQIELSSTSILQVLTELNNMVENINDLPNCDDFNNSLYREILLTKNHITSKGRIGYYKSFLPITQVKLIEEKYYNFLADFDYI